MQNDSRVLRDRYEVLSEGINRATANPAFKSARQLVQTFEETTYPTTPDTFYACHPVEMNGTEQEGGDGTPVVDTTTTLYVDFLRGSPPQGSLAVATAVGGRWVAEIGKPCKNSICVYDCDLPLPPVPVPGATVTLSADGTVVFDGTTGTNGCIKVNLCGTYQLQVTTPTYSYSATVTLKNGEALLVVPICGSICVGLCGGPTPAPVPVACPVTVTIVCGGTTLFSGQTDSTSCIQYSFPPGTNTNSCIFYLTNIPPGYVVNTSGYPLTTTPQPVILTAPGLSFPDFTEFCCGGALIPLPSFPLTDANGTHTMTVFPDGWQCCYLVEDVGNVYNCFDPSLVPPNQIAISYVAQCGSDPVTGLPILRITRQWASVLNELTNVFYYSQAFCFVGCSLGNGLGGNLDTASGPLSISACTTFGGSVASLTPAIGNFMPDPVGGGVTVG